MNTIKKLIKKHITNESEFEVANEIFDNMQFTSEANTINDFKVKSISMQNFGKHKMLTLEIAKNNLISGERGKGKSWILDAFLWAVTGKVRAGNTDVIHEGEKEASVSVLIVKDEHKYEIIRTMNAKGNTLVINDNGAMLTDKVRDGEQIIRVIFGFDLDLVSDLLFFSMNHSSMYTTMIPSEVEKHIIRISSLDAFLELEKRCKDVQKQEKIKIDTYGEMTGTLPTSGEEDIKEKIKGHKQEIKQFQKDIETVKATAEDVSALTTRQAEIDATLASANQMIEKVAKYASFNSMQDKIKVALNEIAELAPEQAKAKAIDDKRQKLGQIQQKGTELTNKIKSMKSDSKGNTCPVLKKTCADLENAEKAVKAQIVKMESEAAELRKQYSEMKSEIDNSGYEAISKKVSDANGNLIALRQQVKIIMDAIGNEPLPMIEEELAKINVETLTDERASLTTKISEASEKHNKINTEVFDIQRKVATAEANVKMFNGMIDQIKSAGEMMDKRSNLQSRQIIFDSLIKQFGKKGIPKDESEANLERFNSSFTTILKNLSGGEIIPTFNPDFTLSVELDGLTGLKNSGVVSYGQACLINMSFMLASAFLLCEKVPIVFIDDMMEGQPDVQVDFILKNILKIENVKSFVLSSSRIPKDKATLYME
jgi:DNA repair exonuclease SbcCD ATPase subunit